MDQSWLKAAYALFMIELCEILLRRQVPGDANSATNVDGSDTASDWPIRTITELDGAV